ncbi:hypothetical protein BDR22DRAFT_826674 [Usnea florida]
MVRRKRQAVTDDVSNDEVTKRAKPRPRKKQAVTKTNNPAIKALIRKNATTSPLLLLPSEVRENILIHLVGGELIHVKLLEGTKLYYANRARAKCDRADADEDDEPKLMSNDDEPKMMSRDDLSDTEDELDAYIEAKRAKVFRHALCVAKQSERSAYKTAISGDKVVPEGESADFYIASCEDRHASCAMCGSGHMFVRKDERQALQIDLNALGVCRQLYEEANHLLWATNIFSFEDPRTFEKFFDSLNPAQKRKLTNIHISADIGTGAWFNSQYQRARWDNHFWGKALKASNLNMLRGVQRLHLCINQRFDCVSWHHGSGLGEQQLQESLQADLESILRLRALAVKDVTVVMSDDAVELERIGKSAYRWTATKKNEYAEGVRANIVDPGGADLVKKEDEAASLARKIEFRDSAAARLERCKEILKNKQADVVRYAKIADEVEAMVAHRVSKKAPKEALKLQDARVREKETARRLADFAVEKEKFWQEQVAEAREKYKVAMARLGATPEEIEDEEEAERLLEDVNGSGTDAEIEDASQTHCGVESDDDAKLASRSEEDFDGDEEVSS